MGIERVHYLCGIAHDVTEVGKCNETNKSRKELGLPVPAFPIGTDSFWVEVPDTEALHAAYLERSGGYGRVVDHDQIRGLSAERLFAEMIEGLYDLDRSALRQLAWETLLISDGPNHIEGDEPKNVAVKMVGRAFYITTID
jgi:hypothetical protein